MSLPKPVRSPSYHVCILRAWIAERENGAARWCFSLQDADGSERRGFSDFESLVADLRQWVEGIEQPVTTHPPQPSTGENNRWYNIDPGNKSSSR